MKKGELVIEDGVIMSIICYYICEVGVCNFECEIVKICCKVVKVLVLDKKLKFIIVNEDNIIDYLGVKCFDYGKMDN